MSRHEFVVKLKNPMGLHTRPATNIVRVLQHSTSQVWITYKQTTVNAKSILSLLILAAPRNAKLKVVIEGDDADTVKDKLLQILESPLEDISLL